MRVVRLLIGVTLVCRNRRSCTAMLCCHGAKDRQSAEAIAGAWVDGLLSMLSEVWRLMTVCYPYAAIRCVLVDVHV
jgi:hypothetical protein